MIQKIKKSLWFAAGIVCLGIAYLGTFVPGLPWSTPALVAAWCFSKSSQKFHNYMITHPLFGPVIRNWSQGRVFPTVAKWAMFVSMDISLIIMWFTTHRIQLVVGMGIFFALIIAWAVRLPGNITESKRRQANGQKLGWF